MGGSYATLRAHGRLSDELAFDYEGRDVVVTGHIAGLVRAQAGNTQFVFATDGAISGIPHRIALSWYGAPANAESIPPLLTGQRWQLNVRLRRPHGNVNPSGFDYEAWLFQRKIRATGYVRPNEQTYPLPGKAEGLLSRVDCIREAIGARIFAALPEHAPIAALIAALAIGDQSGVAREHWRLFTATGTTHLMAISGLHVGLIAGLIAWCVQFVWRRVPTWPLWCPAQKVSVLAGISAALVYVALAGFGVPAQRTLYMLGVVALALWSGRRGEAGRAWFAALALVLIIDPWAVLSAGFWLSFGAVGALLVLGLGHKRQRGAKGWMRVQGAITILTLPMLLGVFGQFSVISPIANAIAIPVISLLITPLALVFALLPWPPLGTLLIVLFEGLFVVLEHLAALPGAVWQQATPPPALVLFGVVAAAWALLPRGISGHRIGLLACIPLLTWVPSRPEAGAVRLTILDVGQGLAIHIQTAHHDLLYDTGPDYAGDTDAGQRLVVPYLRSQGVATLHGLVLSHGDADHAGGARSIMGEMPVQWWAATSDVSLVLDRPVRHVTCHAGLQWQWDGVSFSFLHPRAIEEGRTGNDQSCVLQVSSAYGAVLLPGDLEAAGERSLIRRYGDSVKADVLIAPHHGSRTSSRAEFVHKVSPEVVVISVGYRNRFRHPNAAVVARYAAAGADIARTDRDGAVRIELNRAGRSVTYWRYLVARYWHDR
jgi:competence protein ComEC